MNKKPLAILLCGALCATCIAQPPAPKNATAVVDKPTATASQSTNFTPTHEQALELENAQLRAKLAQTQATKAQEDFQTQLRMLSATCKAVQSTNKWPDSVTCNLDTLVFTDSSKTEKK